MDESLGAGTPPEGSATTRNCTDIDVTAIESIINQAAPGFVSASHPASASAV
jgi:hypothetical protein